MPAKGLGPFPAITWAVILRRLRNAAVPGGVFALMLRDASLRVTLLSMRKLEQEQGES
jgi:hypothetical protein